MPSSAAAWNPPRARIQLRLAIQRVRLLAQKRTQLAKSTRREVAALLERGKVESAKIKVEGLLSEDLYVELLEVLELYCELLLARFGLLETVKDIDPGVQEAVAGIIHAAPRTELKELHVLREMLMSKGGRDFAIACIENTSGIVPERVSSKLKVETPSPDLVELYLYEIAKAYAVDWRPEGFPDPNAPPPLEEPAAKADKGKKLEAASTTNGTGAAPPLTPTKAPSIPPFDTNLPVTPPVDPAKAKDATVVRTNLTTAAAPAVPAPPAAPPAKEEDAFDALQKRFAELKRR
ncbi:regulator of Vps4 activity in the MVB pathway-domain-containing protein [Rhodotorula diobovata]|uniref:Regulator of Vps4 activity in the MVB pathway-domain-containing protein n=1 Tax=Rhodotorula diobovata TaxID=5288 RepID=A0A5C5FX75_9BASI|nr:regulator of Vps4 activity in the MVB pathway-domain-containing protein [Rhodotorula diobovata]